MASTGCSAFSHDGQYLAYCGGDGKLKIWETATNRLQQEFVPNLHLSSPCSVLGWISVSRQSSSASPALCRKRRRKSASEDPEVKGVVAMGSINGNITLYDIASASASAQLQSNRSGMVTALTWSETSGLFSASENHQISQWSIKENGIKCKWKSGKDKVTAILALPDGESLITADKVIKWWDLATKQLIHTFTGHASQVTSLNPLTIDGDTSYIISGASGDRHLSIWSLNRTSKDINAVASLTMPEEAVAVSVHVNEGSQTTVLAVTKSGQAHLFKYQPNGRSAKPIKPTLNILVASDVSQKESVQQIPIVTAKLTQDAQMLMAYGSYTNLTFETVVPDFSERLQCLVRSENKKTREKRDEAVSKVRAVETGGDVQYLAPGAIGGTIKRKGASSPGSQLPMEVRLENLSLKTDTSTPGKSPSKRDNMAQLLVQGLHSGDKKILQSVLLTKNERLIKNTITKLPLQEITPLLKELTTLLQGKTYPSKIAVMWLKTLMLTHAAHLLSHPDVGESLGPILGTVDAKLTLLSQLSRLKGRVSLVTGQISRASEKQDKDITEESLLVYQDPDSSDEESDVDEIEMRSGSDENWDEVSDQGEDQEAEDVNGKSDDEISMSS